MASYTLTGSNSITFTGVDALAKFNQVLATLQGSARITNIVADQNGLTITFDLDDTGTV